MKEIKAGVFKRGNKLYTKNLIPGKRVYGEKLITIDNTEYREWNPYRSKLAASILLGMRTWAFNPRTKVLYLGASTGTTVSHISDIVHTGVIFAVEVSPYVASQLIKLSEIRKNIIPIVEDALHPERYKEIERVDTIYEDVANPFQASILKKNASMFLRKNSICMLAVKSQSIDVASPPERIFKMVEKELKDTFNIIERIDIEKYHRSHIFLVLQYKG